MKIENLTQAQLDDLLEKLSALEIACADWKSGYVQIHSIVEKCHARLDDLGVLEFARETDKLYERLCAALDNPK